MSNPFSGILTDELKTLFIQGISALLASNSCSRTVQLIYKGTKFEDCINCVQPVGGGGNATYQAGGPIPFNHGICPLCNNASKKVVQTTENINAVILWEPSQWVLNAPVNIPEGFIQTFTKIENLPKIKRAQEALMNTTISNYHKYRYVREGEPWPCGLSEDKFLLTNWKKAG